MCLSFKTEYFLFLFEKGQPVLFLPSNPAIEVTPFLRPIKFLHMFYYTSPNFNHNDLRYWIPLFSDRIWSNLLLPLIYTILYIHLYSCFLFFFPLNNLENNSVMNFCSSKLVGLAIEKGTLINEKTIITWQGKNEDKEVRIS